MMSRAELDDIRDRIEAAHFLHDAHELRETSEELFAELELTRLREASLRAFYLALLTAARATVAAHRAGEVTPLQFLTHELNRHGQLPANGATARQILADAKRAMALTLAEQLHGRSA